MAGPVVLSGAELAAARGREAARTALAEDGYVLVEDVLERPELDLLRAETAAHLSRVHDGTAEPLVREEDGVPFRVENIAAYPIRNRCVLASRTHPVLLDAMASLIGPDVISYGSVLVFKLAQVGPAVAMHADIAEGVFSAGHLWYAAGIYLDDAASENGCLWVVPRSHLLSGAELAAVSAQGLDADGAVPVPARRAVCCCTTRGCSMAPGRRRAAGSGASSTTRTRERSGCLTRVSSAASAPIGRGSPSRSGSWSGALPSVPSLVTGRGPPGRSRRNGGRLPRLWSHATTWL